MTESVIWFVISMAVRELNYEHEKMVFTPHFRMEFVKQSISLINGAATLSTF